jgi:hypothetical protein
MNWGVAWQIAVAFVVYVCLCSENARTVRMDVANYFILRKSLTSILNRVRELDPNFEPLKLLEADLLEIQALLELATPYAGRKFLGMYRYWRYTRDKKKIAFFGVIPVVSEKP